MSPPNSLFLLRHPGFRFYRLQVAFSGCGWPVLPMVAVYGAAPPSCAAFVAYQVPCVWCLAWSVILTSSFSVYRLVHSTPTAASKTHFPRLCRAAYTPFSQNALYLVFWLP